MAYPLGWILNVAVRGTTARHLFSAITGLMLQTYMFREQIIHPMTMTLVTYFLMNVIPRNQSHKAIFVFVMAYLSGSHIYRMVTNFGGWDMDITTYTMILTAKLSALGYCYRDGGEKDENLLPEQIERKVVKMPSPLEMISYVYYCGACICGPFFEYSDYINYIERKGIYSKIPSSIIPALTRLFHGLRKFTMLMIVFQFVY